MPEQEKQEQPKKQVSDKVQQYFWSATLYSITNRKSENAYGVIEASTGQAAVTLLEARYSHGNRYRNFTLVALNRV